MRMVVGGRRGGSDEGVPVVLLFSFLLRIQNVIILFIEQRGIP